MMTEHVDRRIFGAIEFVHGMTGVRVQGDLRIAAPGLNLRRNRSGFYVIREVQGLDAYSRAFDSPPVAPRQPFTLTVEDPQQHFLPRQVTLQLPRVLPQPEAQPPVLPTDADNALVPQRVRLWPAACLPVQPGWALLRLRVELEGPGTTPGLSNVLIEAEPEVDGASVQRALTDHHGEALIVVNDVAAVLPDAGPAGLTTTFGVALRLVLDEQVVRVDDPRAPNSAWVIADPDRIASRRQDGAAGVSVQALATQVELSAGSARRHVEKVAWP
jgi:hypothetical protein